MAPPLAWATCILLVPSAGLAGASVAQLAWGHDGRTREAAAPDGHGAAELIWEASAAECAAAPQGCHLGERHPWAGAEPGAGGACDWKPDTEPPPRSAATLTGDRPMPMQTDQGSASSAESMDHGVPRQHRGQARCCRDSEIPRRRSKSVVHRRNCPLTSRFL